MTRFLRGMTWDHARGYDPLAKGLPLFASKHPDYDIEWTRRSLRDFGVQPIEALAEQFDIIVIDHPFCGRAKATGCLLDLRPLFPAEFFAMLARESVGPATHSYEYGDGVWGLPTDAAAQVASYRPDLLAALGFEGPPRTFAEVIELGETARKSGKWLGLPGAQSDAACLVATLAANVGSPISPDTDYVLQADTNSRRRSTISHGCDRCATPSRPIATRSGPMMRCRRETISSTCPSALAIRTIPGSA